MGRQLAANRLDHLAGERNLAHAGAALRSRLEATSELAGLVSRIDYLHNWSGAVEEAPLVQAGELPEAHARSQQRDHLERPAAKVREHVEPPTALRSRQSGRAPVGFGGPDLPPLGVPVSKRELGALPCGPGATGQLEQHLGLQKPRLFFGVDGPAALRAVVRAPVDQVAPPALLPVHRRHDSSFLALYAVCGIGRMVVIPAVPPLRPCRRRGGWGAR